MSNHIDTPHSNMGQEAPHLGSGISEEFHIDFGHFDIHIDIPFHIDIPIHIDLPHTDIHFDIPFHIDIPHFDIHFDIPFHIDIPFIDIPFIDIPFEDVGNGESATAGPADITQLFEQLEQTFIAREQQMGRTVEEHLTQITTEVTRVFGEFQQRLNNLETRLNDMEQKLNKEQ